MRNIPSFEVFESRTGAAGLKALKAFATSDAAASLFGRALRASDETVDDGTPIGEWQWYASIDGSRGGGNCYLGVRLSRRDFRRLEAELSTHYEATMLKPVEWFAARGRWAVSALTNVESDHVFISLEA